MEIVQVGGYLGPFRLKKALIDPGSTRTLVSEDFVNKYSIPMRTGSRIRIELANGQIEIPVGELIEPQKIDIAGIVTTLNLPVVQSRGAYDILLGRNWLRAVGGSADYAERTTYRIYGNGRAVTLRNTNEGCVPMRIQSDEAVPKLEHEDSRFPENDDWATTSSGSTHTSDYTWTERTESRDDEEDFTSSEGSAQTGEYTEEDDISVGGLMLEKNIPTWHL